MKVIAMFLVSSLFFLAGCENADERHQRRLENMKTIEICHDGVTYIQFVSSTVNLGVSVKRERDGKVELCQEVEQN